ncbi:MAG: RNA-binding S4 domain-containing protein [Xanthomonadaceae bacterium]|nr:RNA-binding S4 domain-containing protein [Xanthomonadaceae bacterium]
MSRHTDSGLHEIRADIWLWAARFFKTRALAKQALGSGRVEVNGAPCKAARAVRIGDMLRISRGEERLEVEVLALSGQRGPAPQAQALYRETESSRRAREVAREQRRLTGADLLRPSTRPGKHDRRALRQLKKPFRSDAG